MAEHVLNLYEAKPRLSRLMDRLTAVWFSPTGTTKRVVETIAAGIGAGTTIHVSLAAGEPPAGGIGADLVLLGMPVHAGRIPAFAREAFEKALPDLRPAPAVLVCVYGNNKVGDALRELDDLARRAGLTPVAAASFVGEHSFSTAKRPIAVDRPDPQDLAEAEAFGSSVAKRFAEAAGGGAPWRLPELPGTVPVGPAIVPDAAPPEIDRTRCGKCGTCVAVCPAKAVSMQPQGPVTDAAKCIHCYACIRSCPEGARRNADAKLDAIAERLHRTCAEPKRPVLYLG
jgi:ferredoxin/flavodoxin